MTRVLYQSSGHPIVSLQVLLSTFVHKSAGKSVHGEVIHCVSCVRVCMSMREAVFVCVCEIHFNIP